jgi:transposase-like protein
MTEETTPQRRPALTVRRLLATFVSRVRRAFGGILTLLLHRQLRDLNRQTQRLGAASVESMTYVSGELQALDERLSRIEEELAALRVALEGSGGASREPAEPDEARQPSG